MRNSAQERNWDSYFREQKHSNLQKRSKGVNEKQNYHAVLCLHGTYDLLLEKSVRSAAIEELILFLD